MQNFDFNAFPIDAVCDAAEHEVGNFIVSSNVTRNLREQIRCRWDLPSIPFRTKLIEAYRNNTNVDNYFKEQQAKIEQDKKQIECTWMQLQIDQDNLRNNLTRFNQLIKDNLSKADRACKKIEEEEDQCLFFEFEIESLRHQVSELESRTAFLKQQLLNYSIFEEFLVAIIESNEDYANIYDLLDKNEALERTNDDLILEQNKCLKEIENIRNEMSENIEKCDKAEVKLFEEISALKTKLESNKSEDTLWESILGRVKNSISERKSQYDQSLNVCNHMYYLLSKRYGDADFLTEDNEIEDKLLFIKNSLLTLKKIVKTLKRDQFQMN